MKQLLICSLLVTALLGFAIGCSNNNDPAGSNLIQGDTASGEFQLIDDLLGEVSMEAMGLAIDLSFEFLDSIPGSQGVRRHDAPRLSSGEAFVILSYQYNYTSDGWHVFTFTGYEADSSMGDTIDIAGTDSIQVLKNNMVMQIPDSTADEIRIRNDFDISSRSGWISATNAYSIDVMGDFADSTAMVTFSGNGLETLDMTFADTSATCTFSISNSVSINNIVAPMDDGDCPTSGTITMVSTVNASCTTLAGSQTGTVDVSGTWTVTGTFKDGNVTATYSNGTTVWTVTEPCDSNAPAAIVWRP